MVFYISRRSRRCRCDIFREALASECHRAATFRAVCLAIFSSHFRNLRLVSGLQGSYNAYSEKRGFHIPHGDVIVFVLAYESILLCFLHSNTRKEPDRSYMRTF